MFMLCLPDVYVVLAMHMLIVYTAIFLQVSGDLSNNVFTKNVVSSSSTQGAALFRLQSAGSVTSNTGLTSDNFVNQLPSSTGAVSAAG